MRFHVLGIGSIGTLISHHLRLSQPLAPISLIFKRAGIFQDPSAPPYQRQPVSSSPDLKLRVERDGQETSSSDYDIEAWAEERLPPSDDQQQQKQYGLSSSLPQIDKPPIDSLIVCLKCPHTLPALSTLKPRLSASSVITLLQNGMGVYDELCAQLWPNKRDRPHFVLGTTTHGVSVGSKTGQMSGLAMHRTKVGEGEIKWGVVPDPRGQTDFDRWLWPSRNIDQSPILAPPSSPSLPLPNPPKPELLPLHHTLTALLGLSPLTPSLLPMPHLHHQLLLKLALNSIINPLTAVLGSGALPNGALLQNPPAHRLIRTLSTETSAVLTAYLHSLSDPHAPPLDVLQLFSARALERRTFALLAATAENLSSMASDVSRGRITEIQYINGYLISMGQRLGVDTPSHRMVSEMVKYTTDINITHRFDAINGRATALDRTGAGLEQQYSKFSPRRTPRLVTSPRAMAVAERELDVEERRLKLEEDKVSVMLRTKRSAKKPLLRRDREAKIRSEGARLAMEMVEKGDVEGAKGFVGRERAKDAERNKRITEGQKAHEQKWLRLRREPLILPDGMDSASPPIHLRDATRSSPDAEMPVLGGAQDRQRQSVSDRSTSPSFARPPHRPSSSFGISLSPTPPRYANKQPSLASMMSSLITSAPRQSRTWDLMGDHLVPPPTSPLPPASPTKTLREQIAAQAATAQRSGIDSMIASAPRIERTWDDLPAVRTPRDRVQAGRKVKLDEWSGGKRYVVIDNRPVEQIERDTVKDRREKRRIALEQKMGKIEEIWQMQVPGTPAGAATAVTRGLAKGGLGSSLNQLISAAPRQMRTWDLEGDHLLPLPVAASTTSEKAPPPVYAEKRQGLGASLNSMISSAPRIQRTWDLKGDHLVVESETGQRGSLRDDVGVLEVSRGVVAGVERQTASAAKGGMDGKIANVPRVEVKWD